MSANIAAAPTPGRLNTYGWVRLCEMACIVCVEWEETTGRRAGATRSAHRIGLTYRMGRPRSARRPGVISPVRWNGGPFRSSLGRRRCRFLGSRNRPGTTLPAILAGGAVRSHFIWGIRFRNPRGASSSRFAQSTPVGSEDSPNRPRWGRKLPSAQRRLRGLRRLGLRGFGSQSS